MKIMIDLQFMLNITGTGHLPEITLLKFIANKILRFKMNERKPMSGIWMEIPPTE